MTEVSLEEMQRLLGTARDYTVCVLRPGPCYDDDGARELIWAHGRRNFQLRAQGKLIIVLRPDGDLSGIGVFDTALAEAQAIMEQDPAVVAGVLHVTFYTASGFPGDGLPPVRG